MSRQKSSAGPVGQVWVIDRIEGQIASIEVDGGEIRNIPTEMLPSKVQEGDVFRVQCERQRDQAVITIIVDEGEKRRRLEASRKQMERGNDHTTGDISL
jgi:hypothetical protein